MNLQPCDQKSSTLNHWASLGLSFAIIEGGVIILSRLSYLPTLLQRFSHWGRCYHFILSFLSSRSPSVLHSHRGRCYQSFLSLPSEKSQGGRNDPHLVARGMQKNLWASQDPKPQARQASCNNSAVSDKNFSEFIQPFGSKTEQEIRAVPSATHPFQLVK